MISDPPTPPPCPLAAFRAALVDGRPAAEEHVRTSGAYRTRFRRAAHRLLADVRDSLTRAEIENDAAMWLFRGMTRGRALDWLAESRSAEHYEARLFLLCQRCLHQARERASKGRLGGAVEWSDDLLSDDGEEVAEAAAVQELVGRLPAAIAALPGHWGYIIWASYYAEMSDSAIGRLLERSKGWVQKQRQAALKMLGEMLGVILPAG